MGTALWIGLGLVVLFILRVFVWVIKDFRDNNKK